MNAPNQNTPKKTETPVAIKLMESNKKLINEILPKGFDVGRLVRVISSQIRQNPKLALCDPYSMMHAVMTCAQLGLEPSKTLGRVHLIPYGREVQCIIGYQGLVELARRSGEISELYAEVVYSNDHFKYTLGLNKHLEHTPDFTGDRGEFKCAYAVAKYKDGGNHIVVMSREDIERIKNGTKYKNAIWDSHFDEMAKKTAIRRLAKLLPLTIELERSAELADHETAGTLPDYKQELTDQGIEVMDVESSDVQDEKDAIVKKIEQILEKIPDQVVTSKLKTTKQELIDRATIDHEKAKTVFNLVSVL